MGDRSNKSLRGGLWYGVLLFTLLLVLPSAYLGYRQWNSIRTYRDEAIDRVPETMESTADRFVLATRERFDELIQTENERPFWHFRKEFRPLTSRGTDLALIPSPLVESPPPTGILGHFVYATSDSRDAFLTGRGVPAEQPQPVVFLDLNLHADIREAMEEDFLETVEEIADSLLVPQFELTLHTEIPLLHVAVNLSKETDIDCLNENLLLLVDHQDTEMAILTTGYRVRTFFDDRAIPRLVATRHVFVEPPQGLPRSLPDCFQEVSYGTTLVQGFFLDPSWLMEDLPQRVAATTLSHEALYRGPGDPADFWAHPAAGELHEATPGEDIVKAERSLYAELGIEATTKIVDSGTDKVSIGSRTLHIENLYNNRWYQFIGTVAVMAAALGTGLALLLRSVRASYQETARTRNFVAAVGHELRTPVAALRLYGEMLSEGWAENEEKRREYHERILQESERLELLVNRVMRKTRLETTGIEPIAMDLPKLVEEIARSIREGYDDIKIMVDPNTPSAFIDPEGVRSIMENLVDNARKYAMSSPENPTEVRVREVDGSPTLEISDRGPGVPDAERELLFEAFYRSGDEEHRSAEGIGLGLHLAALHANAMDARIKVEDRSGGGAVFSVRFKTASS